VSYSPFETDTRRLTRSNSATMQTFCSPTNDQSMLARQCLGEDIRRHDQLVPHIYLGSGVAYTIDKED